MRTVDYWLDGDATQRYPQSRVMCQHNKADGFERRLALYLVENFKATALTLEDYVFLTQAVQADCLAAAYRLWRREWRGASRTLSLLARPVLHPSLTVGPSLQARARSTPRARSFGRSTTRTR